MEASAVVGNCKKNESSLIMEAQVKVSTQCHKIEFFLNLLSLNSVQQICENLLQCKITIRL